ncbi:MAG: hypothetical protein PBV86_16110 [Delftia lacustris]|uniref:hypothetical protein n=1 Tax=Delftia TaxID=80865 RepID=UPI0020202744|nr:MULTISPECIES: hypothetical protein [unclassified Delftia]WON86349.1 hypothetical protein OK021_16430 [Delftia sp. UGAL515B_04]
MEYRIDRETGEYPLSVSEIWRRHPNTMMAHHLERYALIELAEMPVYDEATHKPVEIEPVEINGVWRQQWSVVPLNAEELADLRRQDEEAAAALIPRSCTRRQGRLALLAFGLDDDAEAAIAAITDPLQKREAQIEYESDTWERSNPFLQQLWIQLGGTPESLDEAFTLAATL